MSHHDADRRKIITADNNIDLILAGRTKKQSFIIPSVPIVNGRRQRKYILNELDYEHLVGEINGDRYDYPGRPELQLLTIGHANNEDHYQIIIYNSATCLFLLTSKIEDTIVSQLHEKGKELVVATGIVKVGNAESNCLNDTTQRIFRRFIREDYLPILKDEEKLNVILQRVASRQHHIEAGESESDTSEEEEEVKVKRKPKRFSKMKSGIGRPGLGGRPTSATRGSMSSTSGGGAMLAARDAAARSRLLSSVGRSKKNLNDTKNFKLLCHSHQRSTALVRKLSEDQRNQFI